MFVTLSDLSLFAQAAAPQGQSPGSPLNSLLIMIPIFGLMYFLFIRPQKRKQQQIMEMLKTLKAGDKVMTTSGAFGTISKVSEQTVHIVFGEKIEMEFIRSAVAEIISEPKEEVAEEAIEEK